MARKSKNGIRLSATIFLGGQLPYLIRGELNPRVQHLQALVKRARVNCPLIIPGVSSPRNPQWILQASGNQVRALSWQ